jgi:hypothetical protein
MPNRNFSRRVQALERYLTILTGRFAITAVTGAVGTIIGKEFTVVKGGANTGLYTITLGTGLRFTDDQVLSVDCNLTGALIDVDAKILSFDGSDGTMVVQLFVPSTGAAIADAAIVAGQVSFQFMAKNTSL